MAEDTTVNVIVNAKDNASHALQNIRNKVDDVDQAARKSVPGVNALGSSLGTMAKIAGGFVIAQGLMELPRIFGSMVGAASNLNESLSKSSVVFGEFSKEMEEFANSAAKTMGLTKQQALEMGGTFGNLFTAMNIDLPVAKDMSKNILKLGADLASFNNIPVEDALLKLRAGLVGETEPLRTLGVNLSAAAIEAKALAMGLAPVTVNSKAVAAAQLAVKEATQKSKDAMKIYGANSLEAQKASAALSKAQDALAEATKGSKGELTPAMKAQAAYALIMEQTTTAQGDFARTADGAANKQRILKAELGNIQAEIGQKLLPVWLTLLEFFVKKAIPAFQDLWAKAQKVSDLFALGFHGGAIGGELDGVSRAAFNLGKTFREDIIPTAQAVAKVLITDFWPAFKTGVETVFPLIKAFFGFIVENKAILIAAITAIGVAVVLALGPVSGAFLALTGIITLIGLVKENWSEFEAFAVGLWDRVRVRIGSSIDAIAARINELIDLYNKLPLGDIERLSTDRGYQERLRQLGETEAPDVPRGSYATGTSYVPETGLYRLHRGEAVIPASGNSMGATVNVYVSGSIRSDNELVALVADALRRGGGRGVF